MNKEIIIVDDDEQVLVMIDTILTKENYNVRAFNDPEEALASFKNEYAPVFLTDLNMPKINGEQLVGNLASMETPPIIIVLTALSDISTVINLMRNGAYDYMIKPFSKDELTSRVDKAYELAMLRKLEKNIELERKIRIDHQLNWNMWKESMIKRDQDKTEGNLIGNLNSSLVQGAGIGTMTTIIQMIQQTATDNGDSYTVDKEMMQMLFDNAAISNQLTMMLGEIDYIIHNKLEMENLSLKEFNEFILDTIAECQKYTSIKKQNIKPGKNKLMDRSDLFIKINKEYMCVACKELIVNALKFSQPESNVYILFESINQALHINFLNIPERFDSVIGITSEYQNIIFEPFFRISKLVYDGYETLDFGLGLTLVEKIISKHGGKVSAQNLKNYVDKSSLVMTSLTIELPILGNG
jgi:FixJ family two-component response regulator